MATKSKQGLNKFLKVGVPFFVFLFGGLYPVSLISLIYAAMLQLIGTFYFIM